MPPEVQAFFESVSLWTLAMWGVGIVMVWGLIKKVWPLLRKLGDFLDDVAGEPARPGVAARAGLMERVQRIEHELFPNSGKSMRDQIDRMEELLNNDNERIGALSTQLEDHITNSTKIIESLKEKP